MEYLSLLMMKDAKAGDTTAQSKRCVLDLKQNAILTIDNIQVCHQPTFHKSVKLDSVHCNTIFIFYIINLENLKKYQSLSTFNKLGYSKY